MGFGAFGSTIRTLLDPDAFTVAPELFEAEAVALTLADPDLVFEERTVALKVADLPAASDERVQQTVLPLTLPPFFLTTKRPLGSLAQVLTSVAVVGLELPLARTALTGAFSATFEVLTVTPKA